jgi:hypothetical protein
MLLSELKKSEIKKVLGRLSSVGQYTALMKMWKDDSQFEIFKSQYEEFYKLKRYPEKFRNKYFAYMQENKGNSSLTFKEVLTELKGFQGTVEASFASKLLHTICPDDFPTWDKWIGKYTKIKIPSNKDKQKQFNQAVERYINLTTWFKDYIISKQGETVLKLFNNYYPAFKLTNTKKIDLVLWQLR